MKVAAEQRLEVSAARVRIPDVMLVSRGPQPDVIVNPPVLVAEIVSPDDTYTETQSRAVDPRMKFVLNLGMAQPSVFIGSSEEGIEFARAVRDSLKEDAEITLWKDGFFRPGITYIDSLISSLRRFDFAVLVMRPEDLVVSRNVENFGPRDNVVFELGLFMGWLGKERTIMLYQANAPIKLPSDLAGVSAATYRWPREDNDHVNAVGSACDEIRKIIRDLGFSDAKVSRELGIVRSHQQEQDLQISSQQAQIRNIVKFSMAWYIYDMLFEIRRAEVSGGEYLYRDNGSMDRNLRFLIDHGFVEEVYPWPQDGENLCLRVKITQPGIDVIAVRSASN